ncbi:MAG: DivIVA domain-containing protein [Acidobacteria bacterium]|nr:DivIVA domain-containing protein [Acidobacteriota bacterium]
MAMTPSDVEQKTFSTVLRGYDLDEVDDFLDDVIATIRDLQDQIVETKASNPVADSTPVESESVIGRVLMTAQVTADTMIADAREEANQILADVLSEADAWATERDAKKKAAEEEMTELTHHVAGVRTQLAVLATEVADRLDEMDDSIGGHHQTDQDLDISPDDGERLLLSVTVDDPWSLKQPVVLKKVWGWAPDQEISAYENCEPPTEFSRREDRP